MPYKELFSFTGLLETDKGGGHDTIVFGLVPPLAVQEARKGEPSVMLILSKLQEGSS